MRSRSIAAEVAAAAEATALAQPEPAGSAAATRSGRNPVHDVVGVGIGPFNLGMACLGEPLEGFDAVFLDESSGFSWHPGLMLDDATIQVPFLADLVSMADPTSSYSFLNWLKETSRLYPFYIRESFHPLRAEFDAYCRWAVERLSCLRWGRRVERIEYDPAADLFEVTAWTWQGVEVYWGRNVVIGIGTAPEVPAPLAGMGGPAVHSEHYLDLASGRREELFHQGTTMVLGSGQSAAEVFLDLISAPQRAARVEWVTRSPRFFAMDDTKLTLEMTSPEYTDHFHSLPEDLRDRLGREQRGLYKGISAELIDRIHEELYRQSLAGDPDVGLFTEEEAIEGTWDEQRQQYQLLFQHQQLGTFRQRAADRLVLATGYSARDPHFLEPVEHLVERDAAGRLSVARDYSVDTLGGRIFVQNAEEHTHGLTAPDLGMGAWRNSSILASVLGREPYRLERRIAFQSFGEQPAEVTV